jgi:hypothetical protein
MIRAKVLQIVRIERYVRIVLVLLRELDDMVDLAARSDLTLTLALLT